MNEKMFGPDHSQVSARRRELARLYQTLARYKEAESLILKSQQAHGQSLEPQRLARALDFRDLAELYRATHKWAEAESALSWARELAGVLPAETYAQVAEIARSQGHVAVDQKLFSDAERRYAEAAALLGKVPSEHPVRMDLLEDRAYLAQLQGQFTAAETMLGQLLRSREKTGGPLDPKIAQVYYSWGLLARATRAERKARAHFQTCLDIQERSLALFHPDKAQTMMRIADGIGQERPAEAENLYDQALSLCERAFGSHHPHVMVCLNNIANLYYDRGHYKQAEQTLLRSIEIHKSVFGEKNPQIVPSLYNLVALYEAQDRYDKVVGLLKQVVDIVEQNSQGADENPQDKSKQEGPTL